MVDHHGVAVRVCEALEEARRARIARDEKDASTDPALWERTEVARNARIRWEPPETGDGSGTVVVRVPDTASARRVARPVLFAIASVAYPLAPGCRASYADDLTVEITWASHDAAEVIRRAEQYVTDRAAATVNGTDGTWPNPDVREAFVATIRRIQFTPEAGGRRVLSTSPGYNGRQWAYVGKDALDAAARALSLGDRAHRRDANTFAITVHHTRP